MNQPKQEIQQTPGTKTVRYDVEAFDKEWLVLAANLGFPKEAENWAADRFGKGWRAKARIVRVTREVCG